MKDSMKYVVQIEIPAHNRVEDDPEKVQSLVAAWQKLNPIGMYFSVARRSVTVIVDVPNEDAMFEAVFETWTTVEEYADINPVVGVDEFPALLQRTGRG